jgi:uncharacterized membrane protein YeaQ/YmgE (transglycosylase-associated protein family)
MILSILGWVIAGLIIGGIARLLIPGRQPMTLLMTLVLGVVGALLGGFVYWMASGQPGDPFGEYAWSGWLLSIVGAIVVLLVYGAAVTERRA